MASVIHRSGSWYAKFKGPDGLQRRERINAATKAEARRMADDLERQAERQRRGLEPIVPKNGGETVAQLLSWWLDTYSRRTASHTITSSVVKKHVFAAPIASVPVGLLTRGQVEGFLVEREGEGLGAQSVNHLRRFLLTAFNRAIECGRFVKANPVVGVKRRRVARRTADYLRPHEVPPLLAALDVSFRPLFATAIYTGLRKGELMALRKQDVDLEGRLLTVSRSWERDSTKGGHSDRIPLAAEVVPFLDAAMRASPSELVFPAADGSMRSREFATESILRRAMARAGLATGYTHVCRRRDCSHTEEAPNADLRRCPVDGRKLWPRAKVRPLRFHDLRHTTASLLMQAGASPVAVQRILRHRDVRITTDVYGHLAPGFLRAEVDRLTFDIGALVPKVHEPVRLAANAGAQGPIGVQGDGDSSNEVLASQNSSATTPTSEAVPARFERATPGFGGDAREGPRTSARVQRVGFSGSGGSGEGGSVRSSPPDSTPQGPYGVQALDPARARGSGFRVVPAVDVLTVREVAALLKVCTATVYAMVDRGQLQHFRVLNSIRVPRAVVARLTGGTT